MIGLDQNRYTGDMVKIFTNSEGLYDGDLCFYAKTVFKAPNTHHGYHGLSHMLHVTWVCYKAIQYYARLGQINMRGRRNLLIAGLFHDYDHTGGIGDDSTNISRAITGMKEKLLASDVGYTEDISQIIRATQFPHTNLGTRETLEQTIIRDADMSQVLSATWIGVILTGFGSEQGKSPLEMLEQQLKFLGTVKFHSDFGKVFFGEQAIQAKVEETRGLLTILKN